MVQNNHPVSPFNFLIILPKHFLFSIIKLFCSDKSLTLKSKLMLLKKITV
ncbi:hypothetical protein BvCmsG22A_03301 [Escherichia coli]|nr:hypothetical protein BvCmsG22A_03301 [Escherichia coli]